MPKFIIIEDYFVCFYILSYFWLAYLNSNKIKIHIVMSKLESKHNYKVYVTEQDYYGLNMPQVIITEEYLVQFLQTFIFLVGLLEQ